MEEREGGRETKTYDGLVLDPIRLAPGRHDKGVVVGDEDDGVDALGLELVQVGQVGGDVLLLAGRGEGARDGDQDDLFVLELCGWFCLAQEV